MWTIEETKIIMKIDLWEGVSSQAKMENANPGCTFLDTQFLLYDSDIFVQNS